MTATSLSVTPNTPIPKVVQFWDRSQKWFLTCTIRLTSIYLPQIGHKFATTPGAYVSTITGNLPVLELALPFPVMVPISSTVLLVSPLLLIFHIVQYPYWQSAITGTGCDSIVPFPVLGSASSGVGVCWAPYQNCTLCPLSHFWYWALPVPVRVFAGPCTRTVLYMYCPISGTGLCQFQYGRLLGPVPELDSMCLVPFLVLDSASSPTRTGL